MSQVRALVGEPIREPYETRIKKAWLVIAGDYSGRLTPSDVDRLSTFAGLRGAVTEQQASVSYLDGVIHIGKNWKSGRVVDGSSLEN